MEMLLPDLQYDDRDQTSTFCTTDARTSGPSPTSGTYLQNPKPWPQK
jgi:hypothetical protein